MATSRFTTHDERHDEFMILLGVCITEWAWIEEEIYQLCQLILGTASIHTSIIFYRTPTLDSRLALVDELMETIFPKPNSGDHPHFDAGVWGALLKEIKDEMPVRNQLAHSPVGAAIYGTVNDENEIQEFKEIKFISYPAPNEAKRPRPGSKKERFTEDLKVHRNSIMKLHMRLRTFREGLRTHVAKAFPQNIPT